MPHGPTTHMPPVQAPPVVHMLPAAMHVSLPGSQQPLVQAPAQQGSPGPPHAAHTPPAQVAPAPHVMPPQQGPPSAPQVAHTPPRQTTPPAVQVFIPTPQQG
jgi:hypothetical protein